MSTEVEGLSRPVIGHGFTELWIFGAGKQIPPSYQIRELSPGLPAEDAK